MKDTTDLFIYVDTLYAILQTVWRYIMENSCHLFRSTLPDGRSVWSEAGT